MLSKDKIVAVTGSSGLLGRALMDILSTGNWKQVIGIANKRIGNGMMKLDLTNTEELIRFVQKTKPDFVVHAAAMKAQDLVEKDEISSRKINVQATAELARAVNACGGIMVYISTDYVFDGENPPYSHDSKTNPLNVYSKQKLEGEHAVMDSCNENIILRIPVLYGDVQYLEESAVSALLKIMLQKNPSKKILVSDYEVRRPSHVRDIATVVQDLLYHKLKLGPSVVNGIYQWCGSELLTKYEMCKIIARELNLDDSFIIADKKKPTGGIRRPYDVTVDRKRVEDLGITQHTCFAIGVQESLKKWVFP